jgi:hypothetical protein
LLGAFGGGLSDALGGFGKAMSGAAKTPATSFSSPAPLDTPQYSYTPIPTTVVSAPSLGTGTYGGGAQDIASAASPFAQTQDTSFTDFVDQIAQRMRQRQSALPGSTLGLA